MLDECLPLVILILDMTPPSSSSSPRPLCLTSLTASEALRRPDVSASEWFLARRDLILHTFGDTARAEVYLVDLQHEFDEACDALASEEGYSEEG